MDKVRIGVFGAGRGGTMIEYCRAADDVELVAVCDMNEVFLKRTAEKFTDEEKAKITLFTSFEEFIEHDMDGVVLANFANEHAPYAIKCLAAGKHVFSEVLPCQTLKEAVELTEAVEHSDKIYFYGENYAYMPAPRSIRKMYAEGKLGSFEYGEGEYFHNCESVWHEITQGNPEHWRNNMEATFYCTHSIGPLIHITGLRPVSVTGFELPFNERMARMGAKAGLGAIEMITMENGGIIKSAHGVGIAKNSVWYTVYGSKGRAESAREDAELDGVERLYTNIDEFEGENAYRVENTLPKDEMSEKAEKYGHGASDFYTMYNFIKAIKGDADAEIIDIYEAMDMFLPGLFAYRSILAGGTPQKVPNMRIKAERDLYRNDTSCTYEKKAGKLLIPSYSKGTPEIPDSVYEATRKKWEDSLNK